MIVHQGISELRRMIVNNVLHFMIRRSLQKIRGRVCRDIAVWYIVKLTNMISLVIRQMGPDIYD